jgi:NAD+ diphosphatase
MPQRPILYADETLDRAAERREDQVWLDERLARAATRVTVLASGRPLVHTAGPPRPAWIAPRRLANLEQPAHPILLGVRADVAYFAVGLGVDQCAALELGKDAEPASLRDVAEQLTASDAALLALAGALVHWNHTHRFCARCGHATRAERAGHARRCESQECGRLHFPRSDPAVITLVVDGGRCLLARRRIWPVNRRSTVAGFVEPGETLEHAVRREVLEEVGVHVGLVTYRGSQPWPFPSSVMLGFRAHAESTDILVDGDEIAEADWYTRARVREEAACGALILPPPDSISRRLVTDWLEEE